MLGSLKDEQSDPGNEEGRKDIYMCPQGKHEDISAI
jgi:hypothetical protein